MADATQTRRTSETTPPDIVPLIDIADVRAGKPGALEKTAAELRYAEEEIGFYYLAGHGVPQELIDRVFAKVARFHAQPLDAKLKLKVNKHNIGYMAMNASVTRSSKVADNKRPNLNEAYFVKRDRAPDDPAVVNDLPYRGLNQWPDGLPGFRETIVDYCDALEALALSLMPIYAVALDLPADYFAPFFKEPQYSLRMSHYPPREAGEDDQFGSAPHTDSSFMTLLAPNPHPGLEIRDAKDEVWHPAPGIPGAFVVNTGDLCHRWTNHRFRSTPHRVINATGGERYAIPFFFDANADAVMECLPTCQGPDNPARYPPTTYVEYLDWFSKRNYDHKQSAAAAG